MNQITNIVLFIAIGFIVGYVIRSFITTARQKSIELHIKKTTLNAREQAQKIIEKAKQKVELLNQKNEHKKRDVEITINRERIKLQKIENRINKKEDSLELRQIDINKEFENIKNKTEEITNLRTELLEKKVEKQKKIEDIAHMNEDEARDYLLETTEKKYEGDILKRIYKLETLGKDKLKIRTKEIIESIIQRYNVSTMNNTVSNYVSLPNEETKGKIIGKEGRNIRAFEQISGVNLVIDSTPEKVLLSSFDPIRRYIAKIALEKLIEDGNIQPIKIEEFIEKERENVEKLILKKGEDAAKSCNIFDFNPEILELIGKMYFRTSYGQNLLEHTIETVYFAEMIAEEIGADIQVAKKAAFLHDIGKVLDHEMEGTHVKIGMRVLQKFGISENIINAMKSHHGEFEAESLEANIVEVADALSASRPGSRNNNIEDYIKRLKDLESIAMSYDEVNHVYALQAGREIRVFVKPEEVTDLGAKKLAQNLANHLEKELTYPGEIKIVVIRENRIIEYAK